MQRGSNCRTTTCLKNIFNGELVQFTTQFHQDMNPNHLFIKLNKGSYSPDRGWDTIAVADVETGKLSFVNKNKEVVHIPSMLKTEE